MSPVIQKILADCETRLRGVDSPRLSAEILVAHVLGCTRLSLVIDRDRCVSTAELQQIQSLVERRALGEPIAYILGKKEFYGLDFAVTPDVLIPRPETEHIVETIEAMYALDASFRFADLGTGSGILAVTIASLYPKSKCVAVDLSPAALVVAQKNARAHGVASQLDFRQADFTSESIGANEFECIVSNPPYVTEAEFEAASHEVTRFEPTMALVSGVDGLDHVRAMLAGVCDALVHGGRFLMEIGCGQGASVQKIMHDDFPQFGQVGIIKDLAGLDRIVSAYKL
ncbi:peptide chain release factor N(5)-glutamine methyltransferase [Pseudodesulfovibrio sp. JC047]|uniref:peptide chain release factor N(5)-glutamine methyltransferase n=1 Tax=Pseudodesulfovibrio sp. JC047 TaxID=2683199 RepID=UPI0013D598EC|nr:peptide chain release factor N(5)-glutamine methyltransferase [Pseudodesulfovibrio sp. JC047]NDV20588.1 peptide chain release factor N(5)-glutamine methyltransferase [Pseudodesulfovibrio sp. JC047]